MLTSADYRHRAWNALSGKWGTVAVTCFLVSIVLSVCGGLTVVGIGAILAFVVAGPLEYGRSVQALNVMRGNRVDVSDIMSAQNRLPDTILAYLINGVYTFLWSLLFIIPGIIAAYSYSMTYYVMIDNPNLTPDMARRKSMELMEGNKLRLFYLHLSFIGWMLLCALTFGILIFWVMPYMQCATAEFYDTLIPPRVTVEHIPDTIDPFDFDDSKTDTVKTDEPFYVFEEERPRDNDDDNFDTNISGKQ